MGIYNTYPILINTHQLPPPTSWQISLGVAENVLQSEAGTDITDVIRYGKVTITAQFKLAEGTSSSASIGQEVKTLEGFASAGALAVKYYDPALAAYAEKTMRMRNFSATLTRKSDMLASVNGVWSVSFTLMEY